MRSPRHCDRLSLPLLLIIFIFFLAFIIFPCTSKNIKHRFSYKDHDFQLQKLLLYKGERSSGKEGEVRRRNLRGRLGSSPPSCTSKCGNCTPCKPVHVPVHPPGTPVTAEYYPEAWRCKCGNNLYMP